jgi:predicted DNA-binding transcriptional regulator AlpA
MRKVIKIDRISEMTGAPVSTVRYWRHAGTGPKTFKIGRAVVAYEDDVDAWIASQAAKAS